jgi:hypothetical protein
MLTIKNAADNAAPRYAAKRIDPDGTVHEFSGDDLDELIAAVRKVHLGGKVAKAAAQPLPDSHPNTPEHSAAPPPPVRTAVKPKCTCAALYVNKDKEVVGCSKPGIEDHGGRMFCGTHVKVARKDGLAGVK